LEKDLGWGDYLKNLLKCLGNAVITVFTFGYQQGFFAYARPDSAKAVEKAEEDLGAGFSATMIGAGYLVGHDMAISIFLGAVISWLIALPIASQFY
ncbi:OPT/YSL family transporter, partial [Legionella pneumophila]